MNFTMECYVCKKEIRNIVIDSFHCPHCPYKKFTLCGNCFDEVSHYFKNCPLCANTLVKCCLCEKIAVERCRNCGNHICLECCTVCESGNRCFAKLCSRECNTTYITVGCCKECQWYYTYDSD